QVMLARCSGPGVLSFALGLPAADLLPRASLAPIAREVLTTDPQSLQYAPALATLREQIVEVMSWRGVRCDPEQIMVTTGAQQGLNLLARLLLEPGWTVILEEFTYTGLLQAIQPLSPSCLTV